MSAGVGGHTPAPHPTLLGLHALSFLPRYLAEEVKRRDGFQLVLEVRLVTWALPCAEPQPGGCFMLFPSPLITP